MFQIKLLKPLQLSSHNKGELELSSTITLANDLGELFFYGDALLNVELRIQSNLDINSKFKLIKSENIKWIAGKRAIDFKIHFNYNINDIGNYLSVLISIDSNKPINDLLNYSKLTTKELKKSIITDENSIKFFNNCKSTIDYTIEDLKFYNTISDVIKIPTKNDLLIKLPIKTERISKRKLSNDIILFEELSGSIARHLWDAGILFTEISKQQLLQFLNFNNLKSLSNLNILELGTGIGLVSIHLSKLFINSKILATDLEDSKEICEKNINFNNSQNRIKFKELDWETDIKTNQDWDIIITTDCTYNPLYYDALLNVLKRESLINTKIILAHKFREPISEIEFFNKLQSSGFKLEKQQWINVSSNSLVHLGLYSYQP